MTDPDSTFHTAPLDPELADAVAAHGLTVARVDDDDRERTDGWFGAVARAFLETERTEIQRQTFFTAARYRRKLGVYDPLAPEAAVPVATFASWGTELTVPGGVLDACAISDVTVAPTHRRRGLLRALMAGELHTAVAQGLAVATLTASDAAIYGRFGFGPAVSVASWRIDSRRAGWVGPTPSGRIDFVAREHGRRIAEDLHARVRVLRPGEVIVPDDLWDRLFGTRPDADKADRLRVVQYRSAAGGIDGLAVYTVTEDDADYTASALDLVHLLAATDDAYAALWRFVLSMDLIGTVRASELSVDEPLWWMIADQRAATITVRDHHYTRILDVPAALAARRYDVADQIALEVSDPLEIAGGAYLLTTQDDGSAEVEVLDDPPLGVPVARTGIAELSMLLVGGVSAATLARAGRLRTDDPARIARLFASVVPPRLSFWY